jgi:DNA-binding winged helix-turn-helix (wHTH) protein/TolB-like protein/Tfp pilus assembly protein PilF
LSRKSPQVILFFSQTFSMRVLNMTEASIYDFGEFRLDVVRMLLLHDGEVVPLQPKALDLLQTLIESDGRLLSKGELLNEVWRGQFVEEGNLTQNISLLRKALCENRGEHRYIVTVPGHGYRFVAAVKKLNLNDNGESVNAEPANKDSDTAVILRAEHPSRFLATASALQKPIIRLIAVLVLILSAVGIFAAYSLLRREPSEPASLQEVKSIAVLPFGAIGTDAEEYLCLGLADALITKLSNIRNIVVRPTNAVLKYADQRPPLTTAGRDLKVDALLDGRVQRFGDRIRVTVQLVRTSDGAVLWGDAFEEQFTNIFALQDSISERLAHSLVSNLSNPERQQLARRYTEKPEAYQLYLKGRYAWNRRTGVGFRKAIEHFEQAIDVDPSFAAAYAGIADCYSSLGWFMILPPNEAYPKAKVAALKALEMDNELAEAHASIAWVALNYDWNFAAAEQAFKRAIEREPNYATAHQWYAFNLMAMGRFNEAVAESKRASEIDPASLSINVAVGTALYFSRRYAEAADQFRKSIELDPVHTGPRIWLSRTYAQQKEFELAIAEAQKALSLEDSADNRAWVAYCYAVAGRRNETRRELAKLTPSGHPASVTPYFLAAVHVGLGENSTAVRWLKKAYEERSDWMPYLRVDSTFDGLRDDRQFTELLNRIGPAGT